MISRWHALLAFRFPDIQKACQNFLAKLISIPISISLILIFNIQTNNEISAFKNLVIGDYFCMKWKSKNKIKLLRALSNSAKKIGVSANKNDLIVISISFLAFNFRGIIRRTSGKHSPPSPSFLFSSTQKYEYWLNAMERNLKWKRKEFRTRLTMRIISFYLVERSVASFIGGSLGSLIFISSLYLRSR